MRFESFFPAMLLAFVVGGSVFIQAPAARQSVVRAALDHDDMLTGQAFAMLDNEKAPVAAKVTLAADGQEVATLQTNVFGQFSFEDIKGGCTVSGVSGVYNGGTGGPVVVVTSAKKDATEKDAELTGAYTSMALQVSDGSSTTGSIPVANAVASVPAGPFPQGSFSTGHGRGGFRVLTGSQGGFSVARLGLIGAAVAIPVGITAGEGPASPAE